MPAFNAVQTLDLEIFQGSELAFSITGKTAGMDWTGSTFSLSLRRGIDPINGSSEAPALAIPAGGSATGGSNIALTSPSSPAAAALTLTAADTSIIPPGTYSGELLQHRPGHGPRPLVRIVATVKRGNTRA